MEPLPVEARAALALQFRSACVRDVAVMRAIERVPRELFSPHRFRDLANRNMALPIGCGQTMPAPADLARRFEALGARPEHRVLEVGAGSGYSAAVLSRLAKEVMSIERFETLAIEAASRFRPCRRQRASVLRRMDSRPARSMGQFDRIIIHLSLEETAEGGAGTARAGRRHGVRAIFPLAAPARQRARLIRLERIRHGRISIETDGATAAGAGLRGPALAL